MVACNNEINWICVAHNKWVINTTVKPLLREPPNNKSFHDGSRTVHGNRIVDQRKQLKQIYALSNKKRVITCTEFWKSTFYHISMNFYTALSITNAALNIPLSFIAVVGNVLVLVSIARTPSLISPSNVLVFGLAFSDFCIGLIVQPFYITLKFLQVTDAEKNIQVLTRMHMFCAGYLCLVSFGNVSLLSIDRFLVLHLHLRYKELVTVKRTVLFLGLLWVWSTVSISSSEMLKEDTAFIVGASVSCVAHCFNLILYYKI